MNKPSKEEIYEGLRALEETMFPKKCANCGRVYRTLEDFIAQTNEVSGSTGLMAVRHKRKTAMLGVFRNCVCNSTLLVPCLDRRGKTTNQQKRRRIFGRLMETIERIGRTREEARKELLKVMSGEVSKMFDCLRPASRRPATPAPAEKKT